MGGIRADVEPWSFYRARNYALFVNGLWARNEYIGSDLEKLRMAHPLSPGTTTDLSVAVLEVGDHEQFDESNYVPGGWITEEEASDAARIRVQWVAGYLVDELNGENSLASVTLAGARRFTNCEPDDKFQSTRGRVWYTIEAIGGARIVRLWANGSLLCSGSRTGDGLVTLSENNSSGLSGSAILTYTADVVPNQAFLLLRWAGAYKLHYSKNPLVLPRTAEMTVYDKGVSNYVAITPVLPGGNYNYLVQAVGDDATDQATPSVPTDSPKLIKQPPEPVVHGNPTGDASAITLHWTPGEPGCTFTVYYSLVDEPVNLGQWPTPSSIIRPVGATTAVLQPILNYAPLDRTSAWNTFVAGIDDVVAQVDTGYDSSPVGFLANLNTQRPRAIAFLQSLSNAVAIPTPLHSEQIGFVFDNLIDQTNAFSWITDSTQFQSSLYPAMSSFLNGMSLMVDGSTLRYTFSDGSLPWAGSGTLDGDAGSNEAGGMPNYVSVNSLVTPLVTNRHVRAIVRATRVADGLQETCDEVLVIELDSTGAIILPRPNSSFIESMSIVNTTVTFKLQARTDDQQVAAARLAVYYGVAPTSPTYATPAASAAVSAEVTGLVTASVTVTFPAQGYYVVASKALSAAGTPSLNAKETTIWVGTEQPPGPTAISARVIRDKPDQPQEDA